MTDREKELRRLAAEQRIRMNQPNRLEESAEQARGYITARVVSLAMLFEERGGNVATYKLDAIDNPLQPLCFSFDEPHTGARLMGTRFGAAVRPTNIWLDSFHLSNFPKWGPTGVRTYFDVLEPGQHLRAEVFRRPLPPGWEKWQLTCWAVILER